MPLIVTRKHYRGRWKPPLGARVNWGHPLARGLLVDFDFGLHGKEAFDRASGSHIASVLPSAWSPDPTTYGVALQHSSWSNSSTFALPSYGQDLLDDISFDILLHVPSTASCQHGFYRFTDASSPLLVRASSGQFDFDRYDGSEYCLGGSQALSVGWHHVTGWHVNGDYNKSIVDGGAVYNSTYPRQLDFSGKTFDYFDLLRPIGTSLGGLGWFRLWNRALTEDEARALYVDPFQFLEHPTQKTYCFFNAPEEEATPKITPIVRKRPRWKPPLGARVNWGHPLARELVGCWLANENSGSTLRDLAQKNNAALESGTSWVPGQMGSGTTTSASSGGQATITYNASLAFSGTNPITILQWVRATSIGTQRWAFNQSTELVLRTQDTTGYLELILNSFTTNDRIAEAVSLASVGGEVTQIGGLYDGSIRVFRDGLIRNSATPTGTWGGNTQNLSIGGNYSTYTWNNHIWSTMLWRRGLSASEILDLYVDPFQFLEHPTDKVFAFFGGAGGATPFEGVITAGSVATNGWTPSNAFGISLSVSAGSMSQDGNIPTEAWGKAYAITGGACDTTGAIPSAAHGLNLDAIAGGTQAVGSTPVPSYGVAFVVVVGDTIVVGCQAEGDFGGAFEGLVTAATMASVGADPVIVLGLAFVSVAGSVAQTGVTPSSAFGLAFDVTAGSATQTGAQPSVHAGWEQVATVGDVTPSGATAVLTSGYQGTATAGTLPLSGAAATIKIGTNLVVIVGYASPTGATPITRIGDSFVATTIDIWNIQVIPDTWTVSEGDTWTI